MTAAYCGGITLGMSRNRFAGDVVVHFGQTSFTGHCSCPPSGPGLTFKMTRITHGLLCEGGHAEEARGAILRKLGSQSGRAGSHARVLKEQGLGHRPAHCVCGLGDCNARGRPQAGAAKGRRAGALAGVHRRAQARQDVGRNLPYEGF